MTTVAFFLWLLVRSKPLKIFLKNILFHRPAHSSYLRMFKNFPLLWLYLKSVCKHNLRINFVNTARTTLRDGKVPV